MKTETRTTPETVYIFKTNTGVSLLATFDQFNRNWKDMILDKGMTFTAEVYKEDQSNG